MPSYAWIKRLLIHGQHPGGPAAVLVEGEWLEVLDEKGPTGLTRVRKNLDHNFNLCCMYAFLEDCEASNVALLSVDPADPACEIFEVIERPRGGPT